MREALFDFEKGEFVFERNGEVRMVTGKEELKNQIRKLLHTPRGRYKIYENSSWGTRIEEIVMGKRLPMDYVKAEAERCIREAVSCLPGVERIDRFEITSTGSKLEICFRVYSVYGSFDDEEEFIYG